MGVSVRVLMVEDLEDDAVLQVRMLRQAGYEVEFERVDSAGGLSQALDKKWDIIISDHSIPHFSGNEALKIVRARDEEVPFIFVSGTVGEDAAVAAMKVGAQDYVMKTNLQRLVPAVQRELREAEDRRARKRLEQHVYQLQRFEAIGRLAGGVGHDFNKKNAAHLGWGEICMTGNPPGARFTARIVKIP